MCPDGIKQLCPDAAHNGGWAAKSLLFRAGSLGSGILPSTYHLAPWYYSVHRCCKRAWLRCPAHSLLLGIYSLLVEDAEDAPIMMQTSLLLGHMHYPIKMLRNLDRRSLA